MKKYQDNSINEGKVEHTLLSNLFNFYVAKYANRSIVQTEKHFLIEVGSLIDRGEIDKQTAEEFLDEKGIEGEIPSPSSKKTIKTTSSNTYNDGGCGYSGYSSRSSC